MKSICFWLCLIAVLAGCATSPNLKPGLEKTPGVPLDTLEIMQAEDSRNPHALLQMAASLNFDRSSLAARLAIASGRIPCFQTWQLLANQFGHHEDVARALAVAARFPETEFPKDAVLRELLKLTPSRAVTETLMYLDTDQAYQAALAMKSFQRTVARNLWRMESRVSKETLAAFFERFPEESIISLVRMKADKFLSREKLARMPWQQRQMGCALCNNAADFTADPSWQVRIAAIRESESVKAVRPLLNDTSALVRWEAFRAMLRIDPRWQPPDTDSLHPWQAEILAASPHTPRETVKNLYEKGGVYREIAAPYMPAEAAGTILAANVSHRARIRFLENRFGEERAIREAQRLFLSEDSAYALEYLLGRKSGVDRNALAVEAGRRGTFASVLADFGFPSPPAAEFTPYRYARVLKEIQQYRGFRIHTEHGIMECRFFGEQAPLTCASFINLVKNGYFDGIMVHRVVPGFVTQDGDPSGSGSGGPGYTLRCEYNELEYDRAGRVGMALSGKDTGGSQYFITHAPAPHLNHRYTIFAQVDLGLDVLSQLCQYDRVERIELL